MDFDPNLLTYSLLGLCLAILWQNSVYRKKYLKMWYGKHYDK